jgi:hypothetical protein
MADLVLEAMQARQKGDILGTRQLLAQALVQDPHNEAAWMMMSEVVDDVKLKRSCLQRVLLINSGNQAAQLALAKLDTSPLSAVVRGERYKPLIPPRDAKTPPFTPPFTWTAEDTGMESGGDLTYPDLTGEHVNQPAPPPARFDWASESAEPDKTFERIFNRVSNPDQALQPLPDTDLEWLEGHSRDSSGHELTEQEKQDRLLDVLVGNTTAAAIEPPSISPESLPAQAEPSAQELVPVEEPEPLLWHNPKAHIDRLVILGVSSLIIANPLESDIPHILGLFKEKKMLRDLLGENAGTIKLSSITRLEANPARSLLKISYWQEGAIVSIPLAFTDPPTLDEVLSALQNRLGDGFTRREQIRSLKAKLLGPLVSLLVFGGLTWLLVAGLPLLSQLSFFQNGNLPQVLVSLQNFVSQVGGFTILLIGLILVLICLIWLVVNLFKPARLIILEQKS